MASHCIRATGVFAFAALLVACASQPLPGETVDQTRSDAAAKWAANGWLSPEPTGDPEIIGLFASRRDCDEAVERWLSSQRVGNPIYAECLPIDTN